MFDLLQSAQDTHLSTLAVFIRFLAAAVLAGGLGFERERLDRAAGLRSYILVAVSAACFAVISIEMIYTPGFQSNSIRSDPMRVIEAITAGVAFLAAGFIIFRNGEVQGVTTGAGLWLAAGIGLACGLGMFPIAFIAFVFGYLTLAVLRRVEKHLGLRDDGQSSSEASRD